MRLSAWSVIFPFAAEFVRVNPEPIVTVLLTRLTLVTVAGSVTLAPTVRPPVLLVLPNISVVAVISEFEKTVAGKSNAPDPARLIVVLAVTGMIVTLLLVPVSLTCEVVVLLKVSVSACSVMLPLLAASVSVVPE